MPPVNGHLWRRRRAARDLTSDEAAKLLGIAGAALRQIEVGSKPASDRLAYRAARLYLRAGEDVDELYDKLLAGNNEGVPDLPPDQPTQPVGPSPRKDKTTRKTGPKRANNATSAA